MSDYDDTESVRTLDDLRAWSRTAPSLAVVGHPIAHSRSPRMHNAALAGLAATDAAFGDWRYYKFDIAPERLAEALPLFHAKGFVGLNLTIPHKTDVLPLLADVSSFVAKAGAANTLIRTGAGYTGANTDGLGLVAACRSRPGVSFLNRHVVLLGAGGAARAIGATVSDLEGCATLTVVNRTRSNAEALIRTLAGRDATMPLATTFRAITPEEATALPDRAIVINATSIGMKPDDPSPVPKHLFRAGMAVYDTVYGAHETALVREARAAGLPAENGLGMLVRQGALALGLWTGRDVPVDVMWAAVGGTGAI